MAALSGHSAGQPILHGHFITLSLFLSPSFPHFLFSLVGAHVVSSTAGPPLLAGRDTEYLANYDDTEHSAGDSADCAEEDSNVLSQVFSPSTSFCLCFSCLAAICSAFFTYKIRPPMGRPTAALRLSYHCWPPGRLQKDRGSAKYIRSFGHHHSLGYSAPARLKTCEKRTFSIIINGGGLRYSALVEKGSFDKRLNKVELEEIPHKKY